MAIKNFISDGSYTRIARLDYDHGEINSCELTVYASEPSLTMKAARTLVLTSKTETDSEGNEAVVESDEGYPDESVEIIHNMRFQSQDDFKGLEIDPKESMHKQVYTFLLKKSVFKGCISDE